MAALRRQVRRLQAVVEASTLVNSTLDLQAVADYVVGIATRLIDAERGSLFLLDRATGELASLIAHGIDGDRLRVRLGEGIVGTVAATGEALILADAWGDPRFDSSFDRASGYRTRSLLTVPVRDRDRTLVAVLQLLNHRGHGFSRDDVVFLGELGTSFAIALASARMHEEAVARERLNEELRLAAEIQRALLPSDFGSVPGLEVAAHFRPAQVVGGDYFDLIPTARGSVWLVIADISGKGVAAGLIASNVQAFLWSRRDDPRPLEVLIAEGNDLLHRLAGGRKYATLVVAEWWPDTCTLTWVNAGHPPLLLRSADGVRRLGSTGPPLGLIPGMSFASERVRLCAGDLLLLCTDGLLEGGAEADLELFGIERAEACLLAARGVQDALDRLSAALADHLGSVPAHDDVTLLCARCAG